jgi:hypothetical protein
MSAVAQDDGRVAFMTTSRGRCAVFILTLATRRPADISEACTGAWFTFTK